MQGNSHRQEILSKESPSFLSYSRLYFWWKKNRTICNLVRRELKRRNIKDILDLGCGRGDDIFCLNSKFGAKFNLTFTGIDKDAENIEFCEARRDYRGDENVKFYVGDATELKLKDAVYDLVICSEVIEHLTQPLDVLKEIKRILKNGGLAIISTPNKTNPMMRLRKFLWFLNPPEDKRKGPLNDEHISVSALKDWIRVFKSEGFKIERINRGSLLLGGHQIDSHRFLFLFALLFDIILDFIPFAGNWTEDIIFCLRKEE